MRHRAIAGFLAVALATAGPARAGAPPPPDTSVVASGSPGIAQTPDGRTLTVLAENETQLPVAPLTTAFSTRDSTFAGSTTGEASGGTLEDGYQIGCGVEMNQIRGINAPVMTKEFKGAKTRVTVKDIHVRVDGCVGKSNLRSYAVLTSSTPHTQDIVAYYGLPKVF